jgi:ElaB/YqjD/DUF883 family membrane-anchored ribosome-binding protein
MPCRKVPLRQAEADACPMREEVAKLSALIGWDDGSSASKLDDAHRRIFDALDQSRAEVERLRDRRNQRYDDALRDANRLVGDMMAQRDAANRLLAEADRWITLQQLGPEAVPVPSSDWVGQTRDRALTRHQARQGGDDAG